MGERELIREREREPEAKMDTLYEDLLKYWKDARDKARAGQVVIRGKESPWFQGKQGLVRYYVHPLVEGPAYRGFQMFIHEIRSHSGRHRHQGGLALFVLEGKGYTVVDGVRFDWEEGDLILLPVKPNGCEHQHFNVRPDKPSKWLAMIFIPFIDVLGNDLEQIEVSPDWKWG